MSEQNKRKYFSELDPNIYYNIIIDYNTNAGLFGLIIADPITAETKAIVYDIKIADIFKLHGCARIKINWSKIKEEIDHE